MRTVSQQYRTAIQQHRERGYRDSVFARIRVGAHLFTSDDIIGLEHKRASHPLSLNTPSASLRFTLNNEDGRFDPDSGNDIIEELTSDTPVRLEYGLDVNGRKNVEWFIAGYFYLDSWNTSGTTAVFQASDIFARLSKTTYKKGIYDISHHTVQELAIAVLQDAGVTNYRLTGNHLTIVTTPLPVPYASHAECLQLLANLASSTLEVDPDGAIVMRQREEILPENWVLKPQPSDPAPPTLPGTDINSLANTSRKYNYATWERNYFALDGKMRLYPNNELPLNVGVDFNVFPTRVAGRETMYYQYAGYAVGVQVDLLRDRTFGTLEVEFPEYSRVPYVRVITYDSVGGARTDSFYWVYGKSAFITENFQDVRYVRVYPYTTEYQRARIRNIRIDNAVWPLLSEDDVLGTATKSQLPECSLVRTYSQRITYKTPGAVEHEKVTVTPGELTEIQHSGIYFRQSFTSENPEVVFDVEEHYAYTSFVKISGVSEDTEIVLKAIECEEPQRIALNTTARGSGEVADLYNQIMWHKNDATRTGGWMADYYDDRYEVSIPTLGYPETDANDQMRFGGKRAVVLENTIRLNQGGMSGTIKARGE